MGTGTDVVLALLEPGGVATVLAGAVVTWLQTRRGSRTVMRQADPLEGMVLPGGHLGPHRAHHDRQDRRLRRGLGGAHHRVPPRGVQGLHPPVLVQRVHHQ